GLLRAQGHEVCGSDADIYPPMSTQLANLGIVVFQGYRPENLDWEPDLVVVGNVLSRDHVEVAAAQTRGLKLTSFPALAADQLLGQSHALVVAGTHGKTTTASLAAFTLYDAGLDPSFLVGGVPQNFGVSWRRGRPGGIFVIEGDEYDSAFFDKGSKFLHYRPRPALLPSVDLDPVDTFASRDAVKATFRRFAELIPPDGLLIVSSASRAAMEVASEARCPVQTYAIGSDGETTGADWFGHAI